MKIAVLIIHGLGGNPLEHKEIKKYLSDDFDVFTYLLPGHGQGFFNHPTKEQWLKASENQVEKLYKKGYSNIYVIGHSMGGVIASYLATKYSRIKKIVLEAPAYSYNSIASISLKIFKDYKPKYVLREAIRFTPRVLKEFNELIEICKNYPKIINIPTLIIQGKADEIVPYQTTKKIYNQIPSKHKYLILIDDLPHGIFYSNKYKNIMLLIEDFFLHKDITIDKYNKLLNKEEIKTR